MTQLFHDSTRLKSLAAEYGTPLYVYDEQALVSNYQAWAKANKSRDTLVCFAVKANSNLAVLQVLAKQGAGFDLVSEGELRRVLKAGGSPEKIVFSGVGKSQEAITLALETGIKCFNVESLRELDHIQAIAEKLGKTANISLRVNPDVDAQTHPYISTGLKSNKFGIASEDVMAAYEYARGLSNLKIVGIDCHIGSQITKLAPFLDALDRVLAWVDELADHGIILEHIDLGGGLGVTYDDECPPPISELVQSVEDKLGDRPQSLIFEPGRSIAANAGVLLSEVILTKENSGKHFAIIDAAMNDLARPALYQSWQGITVISQGSDQLQAAWDVVGPVCETGDFIARDRELTLGEGDLLVIHSAGAYGFTMASNYNSRRRAAEVLVNGKNVHLARERETFDALISGEHLA